MNDNIYYDPEKFGMTTVGSVEFSNLDYCFDTFVVWQGIEGYFYYAEDSGCSCPLPFEDAVPTLTNWAEVDASLRRRIDNLSDYHYGPSVEQLNAARGELVMRMRELAR